MKTKLSLLVLAFAITSNAFAISLEEETKFIEKALKEGAVTIEQKNAVSHYFQSIAQKKALEAKRYRDIASLSHGGKVLAEEARKREFNKMAESLEEESRVYEKLAKDFSNTLKEVASK
ncbi:MAG: hypothetical protein SFU98_01935 [Leptospiraceae bacterium]|nr:hypothetical protein [Leptospiraceae bacterium]